AEVTNRADWFMVGSVNARLGGLKLRPEPDGVTTCVPVVEIKPKEYWPLLLVTAVADCFPESVIVTPATPAPLASTTWPLMVTEDSGSSSLKTPLPSRSSANRLPSPRGTPMNVSSAPAPTLFNSCCVVT